VCCARTSNVAGRVDSSLTFGRQDASRRRPDARALACETWPLPRPTETRSARFAFRARGTRPVPPRPPCRRLRDTHRRLGPLTSLNICRASRIETAAGRQAGRRAQASARGQPEIFGRPRTSWRPPVVVCLWRVQSKTIDGPPKPPVSRPRERPKTVKGSRRNGWPGARLAPGPPDSFAGSRRGGAAEAAAGLRPEGIRLRASARRDRLATSNFMQHLF
jgi:hypothetical protein